VAALGNISSCCREVVYAPNYYPAVAESQRGGHQQFDFTRSTTLPPDQPIATQQLSASSTESLASANKQHTIALFNIAGLHQLKANMADETNTSQQQTIDQTPISPVRPANARKNSLEQHLMHRPNRDALVQSLSYHNLALARQTPRSRHLFLTLAPQKTSFPHPQQPRACKRSRKR
jgi:hypothetical protein